METKTHCFEIKDTFYMDHKPIKIISGGIHYFRVVPEYWRDRLEKLKAMGCNTVETYIAWNMHEAEEGKFDFTGQRDIRRFIEIAAELGLWVIVRPSPYICAEWEFGGLPAWLLTKEGIRLRAYNKPFLEAVEKYYKVLFEILTPLQVNYGGPIILFQIENEYGYYGDDKNYLEALKALMIKNGAVVPFVTSDGPTKENLLAGSLDDVLATGNFGSRTKERFEVLKEHIGNKPLMCMEFWVGWFDAWGMPHHNTSNLEENVKDLEDMLALGNVNFYMFHGGTNFGFMNGSNFYDVLEPDVTSYDYDAILTEDGQMTPKYKAFQKVISQYAPIPEVTLTTKIKQKDYGTLEPHQKVSLFKVLEDLSTPIKDSCTLTMEQLGQDVGYILYRTTLNRGMNPQKCRLLGGGDRAILFQNEKQFAIRYNLELEQEFEFTPESEQIQLDILMENMGRVNYGVRLEDQQKGIQKGVALNGMLHNQWTHYTLPLNNLEKLDFSKGYQEGTPSFYEFIFEVKELGDTFIELKDWGKGCVWINAHHIGRFFEKGPQKRLYIPAPYLKEGTNQIIIFETDGKVGEKIKLCSEPDLG